MNQQCGDLILTYITHAIDPSVHVSPIVVREIKLLSEKVVKGIPICDFFPLDDVGGQLELPNIVITSYYSHHI